MTDKLFFINNLQVIKGNGALSYKIPSIDIFKFFRKSIWSVVAGAAKVKHYFCARKESANFFICVPILCPAYD